MNDVRGPAGPHSALAQASACSSRSRSSAAACRGADRDAHRRRGRTWRRSPASARKDGSPGRTASGSRPTTSSSQLKRIGARPLPGQNDYRLPFEFTAGTRDGGSRLSVAPPATAPFTQRSDIQALSFSDNGEVSGQVVFAGYGIVVPDSQDFGYDSYATLDVKDKVVLVLRYFPEDADQKTKGILARYSDLRYKAMAARQRGAKAMLVVTGPRSPNAGETVPMTFDTALAGSGIVAASISGAAGAAILASTGKTLEEAQRSFDSGNPHAAGFDMPDVDGHRRRGGRAREADRLQHRRLPAGHGRTGRRQQAVDCARRALRSPRARRERQLAGRRTTSAGACTTAPTTTRRARRRCSRSARRFAEQTAPPQRAARVLVGRGAGPHRIGGVRQRAAGPARRDRGLLQLRHGRPDAGQQADRAGRRHEPGLGADHRAGERRRRVRPGRCSRIRISRPTSPASTRPACPA